MSDPTGSRLTKRWVQGVVKKDKKATQRTRKRADARQYPRSPGARRYLRKTASRMPRQQRKERQLRAVATGRRVISKPTPPSRVPLKPTVKTAPNRDPILQRGLERSREAKRKGALRVAQQKWRDEHSSLADQLREVTQSQTHRGPATRNPIDKLLGGVWDAYMRKATDDPFETHGLLNDMGKFGAAAGDKLIHDTGTQKPTALDKSPLKVAGLSLDPTAIPATLALAAGKTYLGKNRGGALAADKQFVEDTIAGLPSAIPMFLQPRKLLKAASEDIDERYNAPTTADVEGTRRQMEEKGGLIYLLDLLGVGSATAKGVGYAAKAGKLGTKAQSFVTQPRPFLRYGPGDGDVKRQRDETEKAMPNPLRVANQRRKDNRRTRITERERELAHESHLRLDPLGTGSLLGRGPRGAPETDYDPATEVLATRRERDRQARREAIKESGQRMLLLRLRQFQELEPLKDAIRGLTRPERVAFSYLVRGTASMDDPVGSLERLIDHKKAGRKAAGKEDLSFYERRRDEVRVLENLKEKAEEAFTPRALEAADMARNLERRLADEDPDLPGDRARLRRVAQQAELLGVENPVAKRDRLDASVDEAARRVSGLEKKLQDIARELNNARGQVAHSAALYKLAKTEEALKAAKVQHEIQVNLRNEAIENHEVELEQYFEAVEAAASEAGLAPGGGYFPSRRFEDPSYGAYAPGGLTAAFANKKYRGDLFREGLESNDPQLLIDAMARSIKRNVQWESIDRAIMEHALFRIRRSANDPDLEVPGGKRGATVQELRLFMDRHGLDESRFGIWMPGYARRRLDERNMAETDADAAPVYSGVVYRGGPESAMPSGLTAREIIDYEHNELGNTNVEVLNDGLLDTPSEELMWVTTDPDHAMEFSPGPGGVIDEIELPAYRIVAQDPDGGILVAPVKGAEGKPLDEFTEGLPDIGDMTAARIGDDFIDGKLAESISDGILTELSDPAKMREFAPVKGFLVSKAFLDEISPTIYTNRAGHIMSKVSRAYDIGKATTSRAMFTLNLPWILANIGSNVMIAGVDPITFAKAQRWWKSLDPQAQLELAPYIQVHSRMQDLMKPQLGASGGKLTRAWQAFHETELGSKRPLHTMSNWWMHMEQRTANQPFFVAKFYQQARKDQRFGRLDATLGRANLEMRSLIDVVDLPFDEQAAAFRARRGDIERYAELTREALGDFTSFSKIERTTLGRLMFYSWLRFSLRFTFKTLPSEHPLLLAIAANLVQMHRDELEELFGTADLPKWMLSRVRVAGLEFDLGRLNPLGNAVAEATSSDKLVRALPPLALTAADMFMGERMEEDKRKLQFDGTSPGQNEPAGRTIPNLLQMALGDAADIPFVLRKAGEQRKHGRQGDDSSLFYLQPRRYKERQDRRLNERQIAVDREQAKPLNVLTSLLGPFYPKNQKKSELSMDRRRIKGGLPPLGGAVSGPVDWGKVDWGKVQADPNKIDWGQVDWSKAKQGSNN